jgi:hypothetical protein
VGLALQTSPFTRLYAVMIEPAFPSVMHALKAGR